MSIDTCQKKVSADQHHVTISRAQFLRSSRSAVFFLTADYVLVLNSIADSSQVNSQPRLMHFSWSDRRRLITKPLLTFSCTSKRRN